MTLYWGLRDYQTGSWDDGNEDCDHLRPSTKVGAATTLRNDGRAHTGLYENEKATEPGYPFANVCGKCGARRIDNQLGLEPTPDEYVANMVAVFREVRRVLRRDGTCWLNLGDSYASGMGGGLQGQSGQRASRTFTAEGMGKPVPAGLKQKDLVGIPWRLAFALQQPYYTGKILDERDRIWLAATVEAEGCLFIHKRKAGSDSAAKFTKADGETVSYSRTKDTYGSGLEVSSTDRVIVERCMEIAGCGSICEQGPKENARRKQKLYRWNLRTNECRDLMRELYPHLIAKQHEARLLISCPSSGENARKAHESLKAIHQGLTPCIDFAPPEGMFERGWFLRSEIIWAKLCRTPCLNP